MNPFKRTPVKLKIYAYSDRDRQNKDKLQYMEVMYNPDSIELNCNTGYSPDSFINTDLQSSRYVQTQPEKISLELLFDAHMPGNRRSISDQIKDLQKVCYDVNPAKGEPNYLRLEWGNMCWMAKDSFDGRLTQLRIRYTLFDNHGAPLRATVTLGLIADESLILQKRIQDQKAPRNLVVSMPDATSLPALVNDVRDASTNTEDYLEIAMNNGMDSLDAANVGDLISFTEPESIAAVNESLLPGYVGGRNQLYHEIVWDNQGVRRDLDEYWRTHR